MTLRFSVFFGFGYFYSRLFWELQDNGIVQMYNRFHVRKVKINRTWYKWCVSSPAVRWEKITCSWDTHHGRRPSGTKFDTSWLNCFPISIFATRYSVRCFLLSSSKFFLLMISQIYSGSLLKQRRSLAICKGIYNSNTKADIVARKWTKKKLFYHVLCNGRLSSKRQLCNVLSKSLQLTTRYVLMSGASIKSSPWAWK